MTDHLPVLSCGGCGRTKTGIDFAAETPDEIV
jgi:hypothetical protein